MKTIEVFAIPAAHGHQAEIHITDQDDYGNRFFRRIDLTLDQARQIRSALAERVDLKELEEVLQRSSEITVARVRDLVRRGRL